MTLVTPTSPSSVPVPTAPNVLPVAIELVPTLSANARRRWMRRMRRALGARGLIVGQKSGMCLFISGHGDLTASDRHAVVTWLVDQPEVGRIVLHPILRAIDVMGPKVRFDVGDVVLARRHLQSFRDLMRRLYVGALIHRDLGPRRLASRGSCA